LGAVVVRWTFLPHQVRIFAAPANAMNISSKVTAGLSAASLAVLLAHGAWQVRTETAELEGATERAMRLVGRSLQVAVENALRDRQLQDITETLDKLEGVEPDVDIFVFDERGAMNAASPGKRSGLQVPALPTVTQDTSYIRDDAGGTPTALLVQVLRGDDGNVLGRMVVVRPLNDLEQDVQWTKASILLNVLILVGLLAALQAVLGRRYVTVPLQRLANAMDGVRPAGLPADLAITGNDEVALLASRFNAMLGQLRTAQQQLATEADAREQSQRHLQEASRLATVGQLSAGLAHEIGSPLQIINGRARLLLAQGDNPEVVRRNAQSMVEQTDRITRVVENLLRFARRPTAVKTPTDLGGAAKAVVDFVEFEGRRKGVAITLHMDPALPLVLADADQLQQVALNLVNNAIQASPRGTQITVHVENTTMQRAGAPTPQPAVRLRVEDEGHGVPQALQPSLFEPFFTTRHHEGGSGLGLAVVKSIADDHGALVAIHPRQPNGTTFTVDFPATTQNREQP
jgi:signal transduction histidine kinase